MTYKDIKPLQMEIRETQKLIEDLLWEGESIKSLEAYLEHLMELDDKGEKYYCSF
jgi:flagellar biosynthesis component FlhA